MFADSDSMATDFRNPEERPENVKTADPKVGPADTGASRAVHSALQKPMRPTMKPRTNGILDLIVVAVLFVAPWVLNFSDHAMSPVSRALGAMLLFYSLCTKYELGLVRFIPLPVHLFLDLCMAVLLGAAPIHFAMGGFPAFVFVVLGVIMAVAAFFTRHADLQPSPHNRP